MTEHQKSTRYDNIVTHSDLVNSLLEEYDWKISRDEAERLADKILTRELRRRK